MTVKQAIKVLKKHNNLRRGVRGNQQDPKTIVEAIDVAIVMMEMALKTDPMLIRYNINTKRYEQTTHVVTGLSNTLIGTKWTEGNQSYIHVPEELNPIPLTEEILLRCGFE